MLAAEVPQTTTPFNALLVPTITGHIPDKDVQVVSLPGKLKVFSVELRVGRPRKMELLTWRSLKIEIRELRKHNKAESIMRAGERDHGAVIYVDTEGGIVYGGAFTKEISPNCYYVPVNSMTGSNQEPYSLYFFRFTDTSVSGAIFHVEHIDIYSGIVKVNGCVVTTDLTAL
jgi:hypothetical protein